MVQLRTAMDVALARMVQHGASSVGHWNSDGFAGLDWLVGSSEVGVDQACFAATDAKRIRSINPSDSVFTVETVLEQHIGPLT